MLVWVPGHSDVVGNKTADQLDKRAARLEFVEPELLVGITLLTVCMDIQPWVNKEHSKH